jgi:hypothetical protein
VVRSKIDYKIIGIDYRDSWNQSQKEILKLNFQWI